MSRFLNILIHAKEKIGSLLDKKAGDRVLDTIPLEHLVDVIELYDLELSKKEYIFKL